MQKLSWYVNRLRSMNGTEIAWRIRGALRDQLDLIRFPLKLYPALPKSATSTVFDFEPGFRCSPIDSSEWKSLDPAIRHSWQTTLCSNADRLLENRLSFFNLKDMELDSPINWHRDHQAAIDSPVRHITLTDYRDFATNGDCKLVWEPNRHHQLVVLARAYRITGKNSYARHISNLLQSWMDANPFGYGMNWKSPLELGVRLINWIWALDLIRDSSEINTELWRRLQHTIYLTMWETHRKLSRGTSANNHLIGEAAGLYVACCYFPTFKNAAKWGADARKILEDEILLQTYEDGCSREHAFGYQFFVSQFYVAAHIAGSGRGNPLSSETLGRLHQSYRFLKEVARDTGNIPGIGDQDDGYVLDLGDQPNSPDALIAVGGILFNDSLLLGSAPSQSAFWLFGSAGLGTNPASNEADSVAFKASGYYLLRSAAGSKAKRLTAFFDVAELSYGPIAAHGHADALSVLVNYGGSPVFVDSGTYDYFSWPDWRDYFRSTRAHNTLEIDQLSQSQSLGPFLWGQKAKAQLVEYLNDERITRVTGQHDGYTGLPEPVLHQRTVEIDKASASLQILDRLQGRGKHEALWHFHIHPDNSVKQVSRRALDITTPAGSLRLECNELDFQVIAASDKERRGWISSGYHSKRPSVCLTAQKTISQAFSATIQLSPIPH